MTRRKPTKLETKRLADKIWSLRATQPKEFALVMKLIALINRTRRAMTDPTGKKGR